MEAAQKLLNLQAEITIDRLGWAYLKISDEDQSQAKRKNFESKILALLSEKYSNSNDEDFKKAVALFEKNPVSRTGLAMVMPYVSQIIKGQYQEPKDSPYILNDSDLKMLNILAEKEKMKVGKDGKYDDKFLKNRASDKSILNLTKIIDSSYGFRAGSETTLVKPSDLKANEALLEKNLKLKQSAVKALIEKNFETTECMELVKNGNCADSNATQPILNLIMEAMESYAKKIGSDKAIFAKLRYNDVWLTVTNVPGGASGADEDENINSENASSVPPAENGVAAKPPSSELKGESKSPSQAVGADEVVDHDAAKTKSDQKQKPKSNRVDPEPKRNDDNDKNTVKTTKKGAPPKSPSRKPEGYPTFPIAKQPKVPLPAGNKIDYQEHFLISDPLYVISHDRDGRDWKLWAKMDPQYLQAMAQAIVQDKAAFLFNGKIFDRKTGKEMALDPAFEKMVKMLPVSPEQMTQIRLANLNGEKSYIFKDELYVGGVKQDPADVIVKALKARGTDADLAKYRAMDKAYLVARAGAILNGEPRFSVNGQKFETNFGYTLDSKNFNLRGGDDQKSFEKSINKLSPEDMIANYEARQSTASGKCENYVVVSKAQAEVEVFDCHGKSLFKKNVLIGAYREDDGRGDERTIFKTFHRKDDESIEESTTNLKTGAGVYQIDKIKPNGKYYENLYNGNLINLKNEEKLNDEEKGTAKDGEHTEGLAIHQIPNGSKYKNRFSSIKNDDPDARRVSNGCINLDPKDFKEMEKYLASGDKVYVLPEQSGNKMVAHDGKVQFRTDRTLASDRKADPNAQTKQDFHLTKKDTKPVPITVSVNTNYPSLKNNPLAIEYAQTLATEKSKIMTYYKLDNEEYNEIAKMAFGIAGKETKFGTSTKYALKESYGGRFLVPIASDIKKAFTKGEIPSSVYELIYDGATRKGASQGVTQMKSVPEGITKIYGNQVEKSGVFVDPGDLISGRGSAIATVGFLAEALQHLDNLAANHPELGKKLTIENKIDYLYFLYRGQSKNLKQGKVDPDSDANTQTVKRYADYINIYQKQ